jgi:hypothetical protein
MIKHIMTKKLAAFETFNFAMDSERKRTNTKGNHSLWGNNEHATALSVLKKTNKQGNI